MDLSKGKFAVSTYTTEVFESDDGLLHQVRELLQDESVMQVKVRRLLARGWRETVYEKAPEGVEFVVGMTVPGSEQ